ncbi:hypothetical protein N7448_007290 [Penicillium atrosanguineum]|uniref:Uncharacterized protein n=1 Tax=Penicillium atrosanguineum TaxID=1132637 RepID=A0A9W9KWX3_9EURO|nr:hypothetical protein N7448_007290 [Penicillium atrosanguineum]KAJ5331967.1 hypothetical protein N7476_001750 [Penicillium atrosanguineum]
MRSQVRLAKRDRNATPLPYTASPLRLVLSDILLVFANAWASPELILPLCLGRTKSLDELHPSFQNGVSVVTQAFLTIGQVLFLLSLPLAIIFMIPALWIIIYIAASLLLNYVICMLVLNGFRRVLVSQVPVDSPGHEREQWFFINGVAGGYHWLQNSIDQLSYTFGRKVTGIHNRTAGLPFDLVECLIQRGFAYATADVRVAYPLVKRALLNLSCEKVVLILHSQGGIEGGLIIDWLLDEMPQDLLQKLEVYTFGNAANHFNNPHRIWRCGNGERSRIQRRANRSIGYIEHYANTADPVSWLGVLRFANIPNRYMGRLFVRPGSGHLLNQHYLDNMFTLGPDMMVLESNPFMDMEVDTKTDMAPGKTMRDSESEDREETLFPIPRIESQLRQTCEPNNVRGLLYVKDFSRLWAYRNGGSPEESKTPCC